MAYTAIDDPEAYFQTKLYTGNAIDDTAITLDGDTDMQPDLIWTKERSQAGNHNIFDSVRGTSKRLRTETTAAEATLDPVNQIKSFDSDGFTLGTNNGSNEDSVTFVAWCWKGGTTAVPSGGSLTPSAVNFSADSGFGIYKYTNNTVSGATIAHGLSSAPKVVIIKLTSHTGNWITGHVNAADPFDKFLTLNTTSAVISPDDMFTDTLPSSTLITIGNNSEVNYSISSGAYSYIMYAWAEKQGFSKFGGYTGNGDADGAFIYTGFRPAFTIIKRTDTTNSWMVGDNKINPFNVTDNMLRADLPDAQQSGNTVDYLSNGFKIRVDGNAFNASGGTYIYMAFAEAPFVNSNGVPCNAR
jgi:hypothetical protein